MFLVLIEIRRTGISYQNIPKPTKDWSNRSYKNTMGGDGSLRRGWESEKQALHRGECSGKKFPCPGKTHIPSVRKAEMVVVEIAHSRTLSWCNEQHPAGISDVDLVPGMSISLQNVQL